jgi:cytosine/adenosine deaminase-related metal-dependent hydrolase
LPLIRSDCCADATARNFTDIMQPAATLYRARTVVPVSSPPVEDGAVIVAQGRIVEIGPGRALLRGWVGPVEDLGERILLPGLVNAHCHLDYSMFRRVIDRPKNFTAWVQRLNALKRSLTTTDYLQAIELGARELLLHGTTTVVNIESFPELLCEISQASLRTWWCHEMIDLRHRETTPDVVAGALWYFEPARSPAAGGRMLSPHAPFTASPDLYKATARAARACGLGVTTHVAESRDEWEMFHDRSGPLYELLRDLGRPTDDCGDVTPFMALWRLGCVDRSWLLAHMNELAQEDIATLAAAPPRLRPSVVHCPGSHAYFSHAPFPLAALRQAGVNVCLGTDSLASTDSLSMFEEMRRVARAFPDLSTQAIVAMATRAGADALGETGRLGELCPGAHADMIAIPAPQLSTDPCAVIVFHRGPVDWAMVGGNPIVL